MGMISTNDFKGGVKVMLDGDPCNILENEYQALINSFSKKRNDQIDLMIEDTYIFHIIFLLLEEISFDNFVMLKRTNANFEKLTALF